MTSHNPNPPPSPLAMTCCRRDDVDAVDEESVVEGDDDEGDDDEGEEEGGAQSTRDDADALTTPQWYTMDLACPAILIMELMMYMMTKKTETNVPADMRPLLTRP